LLVFLERSDLAEVLQQLLALFDVFKLVELCLINYVALEILEVVVDSPLHLCAIGCLSIGLIHCLVV